VKKVSTEAQITQAARKRLGLTQEEFARRLMVSRNYISQIESGKKKPALRLLRQIEALTKSTTVSPVDPGEPLSGGEKAAAALDDGAAALRSEIRTYIERLLAIAGNDPTRLGWVLTQLHIHLRPPEHWTPARAEATPVARAITPEIAAAAAKHLRAAREAAQRQARGEDHPPETAQGSA